MRGRLDAVLIAARVAPLTRHIGLVPTAVVTHTEPFHISKAIATLDYVSTGRAGVRVQVSARAARGAHCSAAASVPSFGTAGPRTTRRSQQLDRRACSTRPPTTSRWCGGCGTAGRTTPRSVTRRPGGSSTGTSCTTSTSPADQFSVKGPSITPRPPQGQPLVSALAHASVPYRLIGRSADVGYVTPRDAGRRGAAIVAEIRGGAGRGRPGAASRCTSSADLVVFLDDDAGRGRAPAGPGWTSAPAQEYASDAHVFAGTAGPAGRPAAGLAGRPACPGFRLRPARHPRRPRRRSPGSLVPELQRPRRVPHRATRPAPCAACSAWPGPPTATPPPEPTTRPPPDPRGTDAQADPPRRALPRRQQHHGVERPAGPAATSSSARSRTWPRPPSGPSSTSCSWPRGCGCASRAARSTTWTWSGGRTRSPCWPRWPR